MTDHQASELGALIRRARHSKGLSLFALADLTGFDDSWLARLEKGLYASPNPAHLARVAETLDIDPARIDAISRDHLANSMPGMRTSSAARRSSPPKPSTKSNAPWRTSAPSTPNPQATAHRRKEERHDHHCHHR